MLGEIIADLSNWMYTYLLVIPVSYTHLTLPTIA